MQNETLTYLKRRGVIGYFVFEMLDKDRDAFAAYKRKTFIDEFEVTDDMVVEFQDYLNVRTGSNITFVAYHDEVKQYLKATFADQLYGDGAFEEVINQRDIMIDEVIELSAGE